MWDERPFVSPLVDVVDRGRATGLVLVDGEHVRLLHWEHGRIEEPDNSTWTLSVPEWRSYAAYAAANPSRGQQTATHQRTRRHAWRTAANSSSRRPPTPSKRGSAGSAGREFF